MQETQCSNVTPAAPSGSDQSKFSISGARWPRPSCEQALCPGAVCALRQRGCGSGPALPCPARAAAGRCWLPPGQPRHPPGPRRLCPGCSAPSPPGTGLAWPGLFRQPRLALPAAHSPGPADLGGPGRPEPGPLRPLPRPSPSPPPAVPALPAAAAGPAPPAGSASPVLTSAAPPGPGPQEPPRVPGGERNGPGPAQARILRDSDPVPVNARPRRHTRVPGALNTSPPARAGGWHGVGLTALRRSGFSFSSTVSDLNEPPQRVAGALLRQSRKCWRPGEAGRAVTSYIRRAGGAGAMRARQLRARLGSVLPARRGLCHRLIGSIAQSVLPFLTQHGSESYRGKWEQPLVER